MVFVDRSTAHDRRGAGSQRIMNKTFTRAGNMLSYLGLVRG